MRRRARRSTSSFAKTQAGIKNLYKLITKSHLETFHRVPVILKSDLIAHREGLLSARRARRGGVRGGCGRAQPARAAAPCRFYDYLEFSPLQQRLHAPRGAPKAGMEDLRNFNRRVVELGREIESPSSPRRTPLPRPEHEIFRRILLHAKEFPDPDRELPSTSARRTDARGVFLPGEETAYEVVVTNTRKIADMVEKVRPLPPAKTLFTRK